MSSSGYKLEKDQPRIQFQPRNLGYDGITVVETAKVSPRRRFEDIVSEDGFIYKSNLVETQ